MGVDIFNETRYYNYDASLSSMVVQVQIELYKLLSLKRKLHKYILFLINLILSLMAFVPVTHSGYDYCHLIDEERGTAVLYSNGYFICSHLYALNTISLN